MPPPKPTALRPRDRGCFGVKPQFSGLHTTSPPVLLALPGMTRPTHEPAGGDGLSREA